MLLNYLFVSCKNIYYVTAHNVATLIRSYGFIQSYIVTFVSCLSSGVILSKKKHAKCVYAFLTMYKTIRQIFVLGLCKLVVIHIHIDTRACGRTCLFVLFFLSAGVPSLPRNVLMIHKTHETSLQSCGGRGEVRPIHLYSYL